MKAIIIIAIMDTAAIIAAAYALYAAWRAQKSVMLLKRTCSLFNKNMDCRSCSANQADATK